MLDLNDITFEQETAHTYEVSFATDMNTASWTFSNFNAATNFARTLLRRSGADLEPAYSELMQNFRLSRIKRATVILDDGMSALSLRAQRTTTYKSFREAVAA